MNGDMSMVELITVDPIGSFSGYTIPKKKPKYGLKRRLKTNKRNIANLCDTKLLCPTEPDVIADIIRQGVTPLEISEAVKSIEDTFGVKAKI